MNPTFINQLFGVLRGVIQSLDLWPQVIAASVRAVNIAENGWDTANYHTNRFLQWFLGTEIGFLVLILILALLNPVIPADTRVAIAWLSFGFFTVSFLFLVFFIAGLRDILALPIIGMSNLGKSAFGKIQRGVYAVYGFDLLVAIYLSLVPITNDWLLAPLIFMLFGAAYFLKKTELRNLSGILILLALVFTGIVCFGGSRNLVAKFHNIGRVEPIALRADITPDGSMFHLLPQGAGAVVVQTPGGAWSEWVARPAGANRFSQRPQGAVHFQERYSDGTISSVLEDNPFLRRRDWEESRQVTGLRFYAQTPTPIILEFR